MQNQTNQQRIKILYQMLFEMATGNLTFRIQKHHNDELDEVAILLNLLAEKMQTVITQSGYINPYYCYQNLVQASIAIDKKCTIKNFSGAVPIILGYSPDKLITMDFIDLLSGQSAVVWNQVKREAWSDKNYQTTVQLIFSTQNQLLIPSFCSISRHQYSNKIFISSITTILQDIILDTGTLKPIIPKKSDAAIIQSVYEYIMNHLEDPLPTTNELSLLFGTNEFKLKDNFRHFFKTSIYQFYNQERLKKAHLLIQRSNEPIKNIAYACGFTTYLNFYKAFKKRYNYAPTDLKREEKEANEQK